MVVKNGKKAAIGLGLIAAIGAVIFVATRPKAVPPGAEFKVSNLIISPTEVNPGQIAIYCTVANIGGETGSYTVHLGGDFVAQQTVTLGPGESKVVSSFTVTPTVAKTYSVSVDGLTGSFIATTVPVADIGVENLVISPTVVYVGELVTISVRATNYGTAAGSKTIVCTVS